MDYLDCKVILHYLDYKVILHYLDYKVIRTLHLDEHPHVSSALVCPS